MFRRQILFVMLLVCTLLVFACGGPGEDAKETENNNAPEMGTLQFEKIDTSSQEFEKLNTGNFADWYKEKHAVQGAHSFSRNGTRYILVAAGQRPTGGYSVQEITLTGAEKSIEVAGTLKVPSEDEGVTQAITYPHVLISIKDDGRDLVFTGFKEVGRSEKTDSGTYVGQIDSHSIEIKISGVPEEKSHRAFSLGKEVRENFESYNLQTGDQVKFNYIPRDQGQPVLTKIEKI